MNEYLPFITGLKEQEAKRLARVLEEEGKEVRLQLTPSGWCVQVKCECVTQ